MSAYTTLADRWRMKAEQIKPYAPAAAQAFLDAAADLASAVEGTDDAKLRLKDAARECGYSADHLSRMVRDGALANYGRKHSPLVRRGDLPRKPSLEKAS